MRCVGWEMVPRGHGDLESLSIPPMEHLFEKNFSYDFTFQPPSPLPAPAPSPRNLSLQQHPLVGEPAAPQQAQGLALGWLLPSRYEPWGRALNQCKQGASLGGNWNPTVGERAGWGRTWWLSSSGCPKHHTTTVRGVSVKSFANPSLEVGHSFSDTDKTTAHAAQTPSLPLPAR